MVYWCNCFKNTKSNFYKLVHIYIVLSIVLLMDVASFSFNFQVPVNATSSGAFDPLIIFFVAFTTLFLSFLYNFSKQTIVSEKKPLQFNFPLKVNEKKTLQNKGSKHETIPSGNGIWCCERDRDTIESLINSLCSSVYKFNDLGFLYVFSQQNEPSVTKSSTLSILLTSITVEPFKTIITFESSFNLLLNNIPANSIDKSSNKLLLLSDEKSNLFDDFLAKIIELKYSHQGNIDFNGNSVSPIYIENKIRDELKMPLIKLSDNSFINKNTLEKTSNNDYEATSSDLYNGTFDDSAPNIDTNYMFDSKEQTNPESKDYNNKKQEWYDYNNEHDSENQDDYEGMDFENKFDEEYNYQSNSYLDDDDDDNLYNNGANDSTLFNNEADDSTFFNNGLDNNKTNNNTNNNTSNSLYWSQQSEFNADFAYSVNLLRQDIKVENPVDTATYNPRSSLVKPDKKIDEPENFDNNKFDYLTDFDEDDDYEDSDFDEEDFDGVKDYEDSDFDEEDFSEVKDFEDKYLDDNEDDFYNYQNLDDEDEDLDTGDLYKEQLYKEESFNKEELYKEESFNKEELYKEESFNKEESSNIESFDDAEYFYNVKDFDDGAFNEDNSNKDNSNKDNFDNQDIDEGNFDKLEDFRSFATSDNEDFRNFATSDDEDDDSYSSIEYSDDEFDEEELNKLYDDIRNNNLFNDIDDDSFDDDSFDEFSNFDYNQEDAVNSNAKSIIVEARNSIGSGGVYKKKKSDTSVKLLENEKGEVLFENIVASAGTFIFTLSYSALSWSNIDIVVNDNSQHQIDICGEGDINEFKEAQTEVNLSEGFNSIRIINTSYQNILIEKIILTQIFSKKSRGHIVA